jgi:type IV pilus assembly protein PilA
MTFGGRHRSFEAKTQLKAAYTAERAFFLEFDLYSEDPAKVGFQPERGNRYRYVFSASGDAGVLADAVKDPSSSNLALLAGLPPVLLREAGLHGACDAGTSTQAGPCSMTVFAVGNLDADQTLDIWSVSTVNRTIDGESVPAGQPFRHVNDEQE